MRRNSAVRLTAVLFVAQILVLFLIVSSSRSTPAVQAQPIAASTARQGFPDLCAMLPSGPGFDVRPSIGDEGGRFACVVYDDRPPEQDQFFNVSIERYDTVEGARAYIDYYYGPDVAPGPQKYVPSTAFGDPGYAYEFPAVPPTDPDNPSNTQYSYKFVFSRNCYTVWGDAGWKDNHDYTLNDPGPVKALGAAIDAQLRGVCAAGPSSAAPTSTATQAGPTSTGTATATATPNGNLDLTVDHIEIVQVVQDEANSMPLYVGKKTLVRVFVGVHDAASVPVLGVTGELRVFLAGENDKGRPVAPKNAPFSAPQTPDRGILSDTLNFYLPDDVVVTGTYPIEITLNHDRSLVETNYDNNTYTRQVVFQDPYKLRVGWVQVGFKPTGAPDYIWPTGPITGYDSRMLQLYPVNRSSLTYYQLPFRVKSKLPLDNDAQQLELNNRLRELYTRIQSKKPELLPDILVGWLGASPVFTAAGGRAPVSQRGYIARTAYVVDYSVGGADDLFSHQSLAHEIGHDLGLQHTGTTDGPPCRVSESITYTVTLSGTPVPYWPYSDRRGTTHEYGYNSTTGDLVPDDFFDVMNYCPYDRTWISPFHYTRILDRLAAYTVPEIDLPLSLDDDDILLNGTIKSDGSGGQLDPAFKVPGGGVTDANSGATLRAGQALYSYNSQLADDGQGENCVRFSDANGNTLAEHCFGLAFTDLETNEPLDSAGFALRLPLPKGTTSVTLLRNNKPLDELSGDGNAPSVSITSPQAGDTWDGQETVKWSASDADNKALSYNVLYSPDGGDSWFPLDADVQEAQLTLDTSEIAGGDRVLFRVLASDGFNTALADSGPIKVPNSPPWNPAISPDTGSVSPTASPIETSRPGGLDTSLLMLIGGGVAALIVVAVVLRLVTRRPRTPQTYPAQPISPPQQPASAPGYPPGGTFVDQFTAAEMEYARYRSEYLAERITQQQWSDILQRLTVRDGYGRFWRLDAESGRWLVYDGRQWLWADPRAGV